MPAVCIPGEHQRSNARSPDNDSAIGETTVPRPRPPLKLICLLWNRNCKLSAVSLAEWRLPHGYLPAHARAQ